MRECIRSELEQTVDRAQNFTLFNVLKQAYHGTDILLVDAVALNDITE